MKEMILEFLAAMLAGTNIVTFVQLRSLKKKGAAEADGAEINNLKSIIHMQSEEISRLQARLGATEEKADRDRIKYEQELSELREKYNSLITALQAAGINTK